MGVRVKVKITVDDKSIVTSALINSGFESETPDICIPIELARQLKLWPSEKVEPIETNTAGGQATVYAIGKAKLQLLANSETKAEINCNLVMNPHIDEVLLSDYVTDELGITVISFKKGLWRHTTDPQHITRTSTNPEHW
ncbi:MAG: hypothetical protein DRJ31_07955 [Candidatus Methanomethylicota archaeon]|uniref:Clan AA aspartic protease n=1 Tax=Thermoproteota archaeon TaxID=2056631 RepID=A0A497EMC5_9CREN|nr:MAG: hypothetical protein DRJ31_07955 [Candidatus Verstraetearchaeota archaeon]